MNTFADRRWRDRASALILAWKYELTKSWIHNSHLVEDPEVDSVSDGLFVVDSGTVPMHELAEFGEAS